MTACQSCTALFEVTARCGFSADLGRTSPRSSNVLQAHDEPDLRVHVAEVRVRVILCAEGDPQVEFGHAWSVIDRGAEATSTSSRRSNFAAITAAAVAAATRWQQVARHGGDRDWGVRLWVRREMVRRAARTAAGGGVEGLR